MPVPASDAIASDVGHGDLGVRYGLRPMRDLLGETAGQRHVWIEARPRKLITGSWTGPTSSTYNIALAETFDGVLLDVVGVKTSSHTLFRVESQAFCEAVENTFWWSGTTLYAHLTGGADPPATTVIVELGINWGTVGVVQPTFGLQRFSNPGLEAWTGAVPDGWTVVSSVLAGTISLASSTVDPLQGAYCARVTFSAGQGYKYLRQDFTNLVAGLVYRFSGAYRKTFQSGDTCDVRISLYDSADVEYMASDGRTIVTAGAAFSDSESAADWRRFSFTFLMPASWSSVQVSVGATVESGLHTGLVDFDDLSLKAVFRDAYHEPLVAEGALPTIDVAKLDSFHGPISVGLGQLGILNGGGRLEPLIATYDWHNATAIIRVGGRFTNGGNEILLEDCPTVIAARLRNPRVTDGLVTFDLEDDRSILRQTLPRRFLDQDADVAAVDQGRPRPLTFGAVRNHRPPRVDLATNGCGIYEIADPLYATISGPLSNDVYCYEDEESAGNEDSTRRVSLKSQDWSFTSATNRLEILNDVAPKRVTTDNMWVDFNIGGAALAASVSLGLYLPGLRVGGLYSGSKYLCDYIVSAMNTAAGTSDITCSLSASTHKYTLGKGAGTLQLLCSTGLNRDSSIWGLIGFSTAADRTGSLSYVGDDAVFDSADDHVIRLANVGYAAGYRDDASGTYTGTASAIISKSPDVAYFLLRGVMGLSPAQIDTASFVAGRTGAETLAGCIGALGEESQTLELGEIFERIETAEYVDIVCEAGVWYYRSRTLTATADVLESDILEFAGYYDVEDNYQILRVAYDQDASTGIYKTKENSVTSKAAMRYGRPEQRTWKTLLASDSDASTLATAPATQAGKKPRRFELAVRGKVLLLPVGAKFRLTRSRGLGTTAPSAVVVRILQKSDDWLNWTSRMVVIEDI